VTDNSAALQQARRREGQTKRRRALAALQAMTEAGEAIGFPAVARRAGVSVSLLYADRDLLARIADARDRQRQAGADRAAWLPTRSLVTEASLRTDLANAKEQNRHLGEELVVLRDRLARELGADADHFRGRPTNPALDTLEERAAELETDNARLRQQVSRLEADTSELADNLDAAREMNRELMNELNRRPAALAGPAEPRQADSAPDPGLRCVNDVGHTPHPP
jgi:DNA repair exonuclease SbcCD ATPase subunit